jgi:hypothetical protein
MIYRKRGSVARWENGTLVRVTERGIAIERGESFECEPEAAGEVPRVDERRVIEVARTLREATGDVEIERLIIIDGIADHEYGDRAWSDETQRIHLSLLHARTRALLDLASFDLTDVRRVAAALAKSDGIERPAPSRLRIAQNVTAALVPFALPNVRIVQTAGGVDGYGEPILESAGPWPNVYRPSYRVRPVRMPLRLRIECEATEIDPNLPVAVALTASPVLEDGVLLVPALIDDGARVFPSTIRIERIAAVAAPGALYPYGGGSFGAEMML